MVIAEPVRGRSPTSPVAPEGGPPAGPPAVRLLGEVAVTGPTGAVVVPPRPQVRTVLAQLAYHRHRSVSRSEIADVLWDGELPDHWSGAVRGVVSKVRAALAAVGADGWLVTGGDGWHLDLPPGAVVDVERVRALVEEAERVLDPGGGSGPPEPVDDPARIPVRPERLDAAIRDLEGELIPGGSGAWVDDRRREAATLRWRGLEAAVRTARRIGRPDRALEAARKLADSDPYSDAAARLWIATLADSGRRGAALAAYDDFAARLRDELDTRPEPATEALIRTVRGPAHLASPPVVPAATVLVGRSAEAAALRAAWDAVRTQREGRLVLVTGGPGAGKTRLAVEAASWAGAGRILWGRCPPVSGLLYAPVVDMLSQAVEQTPSLLDALGPLAGQLGVLLPGLGPAPDAGARPDGDDRTGLFRAAGAALRAWMTSPAVLVIDDLQWAPPDTVDLVGHLIHALADVDVLVVVTSRGHGGPAAAMLAEAARLVPTTTVPLAGLDRDAVGSLLEAHGVVDARSVAGTVRDRTGGNPFLVRELARAASPDGRLDPLVVPETLRSWIDQRVAALDPPEEEALAAAAVLGADFDVEVIAAMLDLDGRTAVGRCRPLLERGLLVEPDPVRGPGALGFAHDLTRDAVYDSLGGIRRRMLHRAAAEALRSAHPDGPWAAVAGHWLVADPVRRDGTRRPGPPDADVPPPRAIEAFLAAGEEALEGCAWATADRWFTEVLDRRAGAGAARVRALIGRGWARRGTGDRAGARAALADALDAARAAGEARLVAEATLGLVGGGARGVSEEMPDADRAALLRSARDGLGSDDDDLLVPVELELALALLLTDRRAERRALADHALERARRLGRDGVLATALLGHRVARTGPEHAEARLADAAEILALPPDARPFAVTVGALMARHEDALLTGERDLARRSLAEATRMADDAGHPYWRWVTATWRVLDRIIDGDLEGAEPEALAATGLQDGHPEAVACLGVNLVDIRLFQGRAGEVVDLLADAAAGHPHIPGYRAVLALCRAESGDLAGAARDYGAFAGDRFESVPDDTNRLLTLAVLADVAATLDDAEGGAHLFGLLHPHADRHVVLNCFGGGGAYWGPVATQLGRLSAVLGDRVGAGRWLRRGRDAAAAFGAPGALERVERLFAATVQV